LLVCLLLLPSEFSGKSRARDAALNAIQSPLLDIGIERATGIVWNITGGIDLTLFEV
jgi:cell division protein FtsZ